MNIQIYVSTRNPDVLKAERFFKERRIPCQLMDLKKMALVSPIVRNGSRVTVGADEAEWKRWVELEKSAAR